MAKNDEIQKSIGRLEKGQEVVEKAIDRVEKSGQDTALQMLNAFNTLRDDFRNDMKILHEKLDNKTSELHLQIDNAVKGQNNIKLTVQKLATTISVVVGVAIYVLKGVFDVAKDALASSFIQH